MFNARQRMLKMSKCRSVKFYAKDEHGDSVFVEFEGEEADAILQYLLKGLLEKSNALELPK